MDLEQLKQILDLVREHELSEFEVEHEGLRLKVRKDAAVASVPPTYASAPVPGVTPIGPAPTAVPSAIPAATEDAADLELAIVKAPIVGTFYRAPEPGAPPFVDVGGRVKRGQVLCIIEAMKLMNEIDSEYEGEIVKVYVENAQPVQYGERLFAIKTK
jgi:acetyl-CoA carboxylase biotin carboxyl carrier protein